MGNRSSDLGGIEGGLNPQIAQPKVSDGLVAGGGKFNDGVEFFGKAKDLHILPIQLELSLSVPNLRDCDAVSKRNPIAVVYIKTRDGDLEEVGRTEVTMNSLEPSGIQNIHITYHFEIVQTLIIYLYDVNAKSHNLPLEVLNLNDQDFLGEASCIVSEILNKWDRSMALTLHNNNAGGSRHLRMLAIHAAEIVESRNEIELLLSCANMRKKDLYSKSDRFLRISRLLEDGGCVQLCKTETVNNSNLEWKPVRLYMKQLVTKENQLMLECFDCKGSGNHTLVGIMQKSVAELENMHRMNEGQNFILPPSGSRHHSKVLKGQLFVNGYKEKETYSFLDYVAGGCELSFMVAIDFNASNGDPRSPDSLHYIDPSGSLNPYQRAIMEVGAVVQYYNSDRRFPAWGFGGQTSSNCVSHCFNLSPKGVEVEGVEGIMSAYATALQNVTLSGPTIFSQVISKAAETAGIALSHNQAKYHVLLIITDGVVTDLQETKDAIARASNLPLSILIVGVGGADFRKMEVFNADNGGKRLESSSGRLATRDIAQFVPMHEVHGGQNSAIQTRLKELPNQFLSYVRSRNIKPLGYYGASALSRKTSHGAPSLSRKTSHGPPSLSRKTSHGGLSISRNTSYGALSISRNTSKLELLSPGNTSYGALSISRNTSKLELLSPGSYQSR